MYQKSVVNIFSWKKKSNNITNISLCVCVRVFFLSRLLCDVLLFSFNARAVLFHINVCVCCCYRRCCCCYFVFVVVLMAPEDATVPVVAFFHTSIIKYTIVVLLCI